jgi:hypothetical protein
MSPSAKSVEDLKKLSLRLDQETDTLNQVFKAFEEELRAAKVSVSAWTDRELFEVDEESYDEDRDRGVDVGWTIGYCKISVGPNPGWQVAARKEKWRFAGRGDDRNYEGDELVVDGPMPISQAPRLVRVEAAGVLDELVEKLTEKTQYFLGNIEKAKKTGSVGDFRPWGDLSRDDQKHLKADPEWDGCEHEKFWWKRSSVGDGITWDRRDAAPVEAAADSAPVKRAPTLAEVQARRRDRNP